MTQKSNSNQPDYIIKYKKFLSIEGGLSSDDVDRYNTKKKYHTNKGVRWTTFKLIHPNLTYKDFLSLNDSTYYETIKYHERVVKSLVREDLDTPVKLFLIEELWACGNLDSYKSVDYNIPTKDLLPILYQLKEYRYSRILKKKPYLNKYKRGWKRRRVEFLEFNSQFINN